MLVLSGLRKRFGATVALDGVDVNLAPGEVHALIGENGAGKSTLLNVIAGGLLPDAGTMQVNGAPYAPSSPLAARHAGVALIHQELSLCSHLTVAENILMGLEPAHGGWLDRAAMRREAARLLESFTHPDLAPDRVVGTLPIAARQVVEILRAIAARASIVLMDEPTSSLPREDVTRLFALIRRLKAGGVTIVYISHFLEEVREIADRYTVLRDGRSVASGTLTDVTNEALIAHMVGRPVDALFPERAPAPREEVLVDVVDVAAPPAVRRAAFRLRRGEILGVAGLVGSGRTETIRALMGLEPAEGGEVRVRGRRLARTASPSVRLAAGFGYLSEDRKGEGLSLDLSLADNITCTRYRACSTRGWLRRGAQRDQTRHWLDVLAVKARSPWQAARTLSGGNQQKVAMARLLHQEADVLLLDEPTKGIDIGSKVEIYRAIVACATRGAGVVMVSSYLPELFGVCHSLAVMCRGRLTPVRPIHDWTPESVMEAAIGG
ncbi:MAG: sugar ABC transporter ATP-binding protein [Vicinamibacteraceae bacterium]